MGRNFIPFTEVQKTMEELKEQIREQFESSNDEVMNYEDLEKYLRHSFTVSTLQKMVSQGKIPHKRISGKTTLFLKSEIMDWIKNSTTNNS